MVAKGAWHGLRGVAWLRAAALIVAGAVGVTLVLESAGESTVTPASGACQWGMLVSSLADASMSQGSVCVHGVAERQRDVAVAESKTVKTARLSYAAQVQQLKATQLRCPMSRYEIRYDFSRA